MTAIAQQEKDQSQDIAETGWRMEIITKPDGTEDIIHIPLTETEFLHPQEGYRLPNSTFHDSVVSDAKDMLSRRYASDPETVVFGDLIIKWDIENLRDHCPDAFVAFGVQNKQQNRTEFTITKEGVRPSLIIEVVSPRYRKADRQTKVKQYAQAKVQEYVIIDRRTQRGQVIEEVLGYQLIEGQYLPMTPDDDGRIFSETVGLWMGLQNSRVVMETQAGERLLTSLELEQQAEQAQQRAAQAEQRATQAEQRATRLAELLRAQGIDPEQV